MTRNELAEKLNVSLRTLSNWEKEKPELVKLINIGLSLDKQIEETENHLKHLKSLKEDLEEIKFKLN
ncbi:MAG: helix-turn-helix domain-containing protein [Epsilonproteobacteria bacterium]|nr:helix-turn-helix domain-containing protein [Campylobacterota bacterium]